MHGIKPHKINTTKHSPIIKILTSLSMLCLLILCTLDCKAVNSSSPLSHPKFFLSCRVIAGICQNDIQCLEVMSARFPNCYLENLLDLKERGSKMFAGELGYGEEPNEMQQLPNKRTPAFKLMKVLMMKDRIPVGRR